MNETKQENQQPGGSNAKILHKLPEINANILVELEKEATQISKEFYQLTKQLQTCLNQISAASVCSLQTFDETVNKKCHAFDECTRDSGILLQKANELSKSMEPVYKLQVKLNSIKTVLAALESQI